MGHQNKKNLVIHAGMHKTGSSSIQSSLFLNRDALNEHGIAYPERGLVKDEEVGFRHLKFSNSLKQHAFNEAALLSEIVHLNSLSASTIVISHEDLLRLDLHEKALKLLGESFNISLVAYVKDPILYFNDKYKEWVRRMGCALEPADFVLQHFDYLHWDRLAKKWESFIGRDNIYLFPFEKAHFRNGSVLTHFYDLLSHICGVQINQERLAPLMANQNTSLNNKAILATLLANKEPEHSHTGVKKKFLKSANQMRNLNSSGLLISRECARQLKARSWHAWYYLKTHYNCNVSMKKLDEYKFDSAFHSYRIRYDIYQNAHKKSLKKRISQLLLPNA
jgi:hypothetical protein